MPSSLRVVFFICFFVFSPPIFIHSFLEKIGACRSSWRAPQIEFPQESNFKQVVGSLFFLFFLKSFPFLFFRFSLWFVLLFVSIIPFFCFQFFHLFLFPCFMFFFFFKSVKWHSLHFSFFLNFLFFEFFILVVCTFVFHVSDQIYVNKEKIGNFRSLFFFVSDSEVEKVKTPRFGRKVALTSYPSPPPSKLKSNPLPKVVFMFWLLVFLISQYLKICLFRFPIFLPCFSRYLCFIGLSLFSIFNQKSMFFPMFFSVGCGTGRAPGRVY